MAINASTVWEFRTDGSDNNGGGYAGGGIDYSQSTASILSLTDASQVLASNTLTTVLGTFTSAMSGNTMFIRSGVNFVTGFYQIIKFVDSTNVVIDRTCTSGGAGSLGTGEIGGCRANIDTNLFSSAIVAANTAYIKVGTYNLTQPFLSTNGSFTTPILWIGYNVSRGDNPTSDGRPLINGNTKSFTFGNRNIVFYLNLLTTSTSGIGDGISSSASYQFCKIVSQGTGAGCFAVKLDGSSAYIFQCEISNSFGFGISTNNSQPGNVIFGNYIHGCSSGMYAVGAGCVIAYNLFVANSLGLDAATNSGVQRIIGNLFYNSDSSSGLGAKVGIDGFLINNIFTGLSTALVDNALHTYTLFNDYNDFYNNGTDHKNIITGPHESTLNPQFTNAPTDFSIGTNLRAIGFPGIYTSLTSTIGYMDIGPVQSNTSGASSGSGGGITNGFISGIIGS